MKKCRLKGKFEYLQYTGEGQSKIDCIAFIRSFGLEKVNIDGFADLFVFCKYNSETKEITNASVLNVGDYLVKFGDDDFNVYEEKVFEETFETIDE